jgi:hypothetical protein
MFSQLLKLFPRTEFQALVTRTHAERHARGFTCWGQFVAMLFCQLGRAHSLREICGGLRSSEGKLTHLGITAPSRSTLAYANEHRPWQLYRAVFQALLARCQPLARGRRPFRFKNKLVSLDSTVIDLCATLFDWAQFRRTKGAVKLHCLLDHDGYLPSVVVITEGKRHDVRVARTLRFDPGTIVVMDRGYTDYAWFGQLTAQGVWFVTRQKDAAVYEAVEERRIPLQGRVERDQVIRLTGAAAAEKCPHALRRVEVYDPEKDETLVFLTNHLTFGATTIAAIYKDRWQIELFFKALKQNLKIKTFVGTSANALKVQVWTALIALLLLKYLQLRSRFGWVALEPRGAAADEPLHASRSLGVARSAIRRPAHHPGGGPGGAGPCLIGTAGLGNLISLLAPSRPISQEIARSLDGIPANWDSSVPNY